MVLSLIPVPSWLRVIADAVSFSRYMAFCIDEEAFHGRADRKRSACGRTMIDPYTCEALDVWAYRGCVRLDFSRSPEADGHRAK